MAEPEVALVFTPEAWVEELHRHLTDHGGARVRQVVVEPDVALEEEYDVLVVELTAGRHSRTRSSPTSTRAGARCSASTTARSRRPRAPARGRRRRSVESDSRPARVRRRRSCTLAGAPRRAGSEPRRAERRAGTARTRRCRRRSPGRRSDRDRGAARGYASARALVDADDVAPVDRAAPRACRSSRTSAPRSTRSSTGAARSTTRSDAPTHVGVLRCSPASRTRRAWAQVRPGEVVRVVERLAATRRRRRRRRTRRARGRRHRAAWPARASRARSWSRPTWSSACAPPARSAWRASSRGSVDVRPLAPETPLVVVVNRAPAARFRRGELYDELTRSLPPCADRVRRRRPAGRPTRVGRRIGRAGPFTRGDRDVAPSRAHRRTVLAHDRAPARACERARDRAHATPTT